MHRDIAIGKYGSAQTLKLRDLAPRPPADGEVAIDVAYSGVNFADIQMRLGFYPDAGMATQARAQRTAERERLLRALRREALWPADDESIPEYSAALSRAVHVYLARSESALVTVQLEDMIGMLEPVNVPGTSSEYSNWTRRMTASAREIFARKEVGALAAAVTAARREGAP